MTWSQRWSRFTQTVLSKVTNNVLKSRLRALFSLCSAGPCLLGCANHTFHCFLSCYLLAAFLFGLALRILCLSQFLPSRPSSKHMLLLGCSTATFNAAGYRWHVPLPAPIITMAVVTPYDVGSNSSLHFKNNKWRLRGVIFSKVTQLVRGRGQDIICTCLTAEPGLWTPQLSASPYPQ